MADGASLDVLENYFENIIGYNTVFPPSTVAVSSGAAVYGNDAVILAGRNYFFRAGYGVAAVNSICMVNGNDMQDVQTGVSSDQGWGAEIASNPNLKFRDFGIHVYRPRFVSGPLSTHWDVFDNHNITTIGTDVQGYTQAAILVSAPVSADALHLLHIQSNDILLNKPIEGQVLHNIQGALIEQNAITLNNDGEFQSNHGILLESSGSNWLYGNSVGANTLMTGVYPTIGIRTDLSMMNTYCCNATTNTTLGTWFLGNCSHTILRNHSFDNHTTVLQCSGPISDQPDLSTSGSTDDNHSNIFNSGSGLALHTGNQPSVDDSQFPVETDFHPDWPDAFIPDNPNHYDPSGWFYISENEKKSCNVTDCDAPPMFRGNAVDDTDRHAVDGSYLDGGPRGAATTWEGRLRLYARLKIFPNLYTQDPQVEQFYNAQQNNGVFKAFYEAEQAIAFIDSMPEALQIQMGNALIQLKGYHNQIDAAWDGLTNGADPATTYSQINQYIHEAAPALHDWKNAKGQLETLQGARIAFATALVSGLPEADILQQNRKTVLRIYLQTLGQEHQVLTETQFAAISAIAHQCPTEGGSAVFMARALYQTKELTSFDDQNCIPVAERYPSSVEPMANRTMLIQPNPADESVIVRIDTTEKSESPVLISIFDMEGRIAFQTYATLGIPVRLDTHELSAGVYICRAVVPHTDIILQKLVIQH